MLSITLKQLELFIAVAETNSFSKAAELMSFSQSAVSANISLLEEILQTELLDRTNKKKVVITEDGLSFYKKAKEILSSCYAFQKMAHDDQNQNSISIGAHNISARYILTDVMTFYRKSHSSTRFSLKEGNDSEVLNLLNERKIDFAIVSQLEQDPKMKALPFYNDSIILGLPNTPRYQCLLKKKPTIHELLATESFVWNQPLNEISCDYLRQINVEKKELNIIAEMNSEQLAKNAVIDGLGISFLSKISLKCAMKSAEILTYELPLFPSRTFQIVYPRKIQLNDAGKDFVQFLRSGSFDFDKCMH